MFILGKYGKSELFVTYRYMDFSEGVGAFCHKTESDLLLFLFL